MRRGVRRLLRLVPLLVVGTLAVINWPVVRGAATDLARLDPVVLIDLPLFLVWNLAAAAGWRALLVATCGAGRLSSCWRLSVLRIQSQAVNMTVPLTGLGGEALRASLAAPTTDDLPSSVTATLLDNVAITIAGLVTAVGWVALRFSGAPPEVRPLHVAVVAVGSVVLCVALALLPFVVARPLRRRVRSTSVVGRALEPLARRPRVLGRALVKATTWHVAERFLTVLELYLAMAALGVPGTLADAAFLTAVVILTSFALFIMPGQLGATEVALVGACAWLGLPATVAVAIALVRRGRQLLMTGFGWLSLSFERRLMGTESVDPPPSSAVAVEEVEV